VLFYLAVSQARAINTQIGEILSHEDLHGAGYSLQARAFENKSHQQYLTLVEANHRYDAEI
jgi:hypothetical protein